MSYPGFDVSVYPNDQVMIDLHDSTNFKWCAYYLAPAPNHAETSWLGRRTNLAAIGWNFALLYVGEQQPDQATPFLSTNLSAAKGTADGMDAVNLAIREGFPNNSVIYLDVESGGPIQPEMLDYTAAWQTQIINSGYLPGIYCSYLVADAFQKNAVVLNLLFWIFRMIDQGSQNGSYNSPFPTPDAVGCSIAYATIWQYAQNKRISWAGNALPSVDMDVSSVLDPSRPSDVSGILGRIG